MIPSIQITGTIHEPESYTILSGATTGTINLPDTSLVDLQNIVNPVNFNIANLVTYIGKRILIEKPQDTTGIAITITAPVVFSGSNQTFPLSSTLTLPDGATSLELVFGSTTYISVSNISFSSSTIIPYTPAVPTNWSNSFSLAVPTNTNQALDELANNMNERYASRYRIQNLNSTATFGFNGLLSSDILTLGVGSITAVGTGTFSGGSTGANTVITSGTTMNITSGGGMSVNSGGNFTLTGSGGGTILMATSTGINCTAGNMSIATNSLTGNSNFGSSANTSGTTNLTSGFNVNIQIINGSTLMNGSIVRGKGVPSSTTTSNSFFGASDGVALANASLVTFYSPTHLYYALPATNSSYTVDVVANLSDNANPLNFFTARISVFFSIEFFKGYIPPLEIVFNFTLTT